MSYLWRRSGPVRTVERYLEASNANDLDAMAEFMAADFRVIDSTGESVEGRENVLLAMRRFIRLAPDYRIEDLQLSSRGEHVFIKGHTRCSDQRLVGDTLWRALADERQMYEWQSFSRDYAPHLSRILMPELQPFAAGGKPGAGDMWGGSIGPCSTAG